MPDTEDNFLDFRNDLILKYGEERLKTAANKCLALFFVFLRFSAVPKNASFEEEMRIFLNLNYKGPLNDELSDIQNEFLNNRYLEIIKENGDHEYFNTAGLKTVEDKISAAKALGRAQYLDQGKKVSTGQTNMDLALDLFKLYGFQYFLYRENPQHPIFLNAVPENIFIEQLHEQQGPPTQPVTKTGGCLGVILFFVSIATAFILAIL